MSLFRSKRPLLRRRRVEQPQVVDLLQQTEPLRQAVGAGAALALRFQLAAADDRRRHGPKRSLEKDQAVNAVLGQPVALADPLRLAGVGLFALRAVLKLVRQQGRMVFPLRFPHRLEFLLEHVAAGVPTADAHPEVRVLQVRQVFAECAAYVPFHTLREIADLLQHLRIFFLSLAVGLAVGQEPPPLVQMNQHATNLERRQLLVQRPPPQFVGIEFVQGLLLGPALRQQADLHQSGAQQFLAPRAPGDLPAHAAGDPALLVFGLLAALLVAVHALRKDADAGRHQTRVVLVHQRPADRVGTKIESQGEGGVHVCASREKYLTKGSRHVRIFPSVTDPGPWSLVATRKKFAGNDLRIDGLAASLTRGGFFCALLRPFPPRPFHFRTEMLRPKARHFLTGIHTSLPTSPWGMVHLGLARTAPEFGPCSLRPCRRRSVGRSRAASHGARTPKRATRCR